MAMLVTLGFRVVIHPQFTFRKNSFPSRTCTRRSDMLQAASRWNFHFCYVHCRLVSMLWPCFWFFTFLFIIFLFIIILLLAFTFMFPLRSFALPLVFFCWLLMKQTTEHRCLAMFAKQIVKLISFFVFCFLLLHGLQNLSNLFFRVCQMLHKCFHFCCIALTSRPFEHFQLFHHHVQCIACQAWAGCLPLPGLIIYRNATTNKLIISISPTIDLKLARVSMLSHSPNNSAIWLFKMYDWRDRRHGLKLLLKYICGYFDSLPFESFLIYIYDFDSKCTSVVSQSAGNW